MPLAPDDLVLCSGTVRHASLVDKLRAALDAGFAGLSLYLADFDRAAETGLLGAAVARVIADHGIAIAELDGLTSWLPGPRPRSTRTVREFVDAASLVGARSLNAVEAAGTQVGVDVPIEAAAEAFAHVCDEARSSGLLVTLEYYPWSGIADSRTALQIVQCADRPNGGVLLDTWHHLRGPDGGRLDLGDLAPQVFGVQVSDAQLVAEPDVAAESLHRRVAPGEGTASSGAMLVALRRHGCVAPFGVEIYADEYDALPADEAARRAAVALRRVVPTAI